MKSLKRYTTAAALACFATVTSAQEESSIAEPPSNSEQKYNQNLEAPVVNLRDPISLEMKTCGGRDAMIDMFGRPTNILFKADNSTNSAYSIHMDANNKLSLIFTNQNGISCLIADRMGTAFVPPLSGSPANFSPKG